MRRALALLVAVLLSGCSSRDRGNPLDPLNPATGGRPSGFVAIAGHRQVLLQWDGNQNAGGLPVLLERQVEGTTTVVTLADGIPPDRTSYIDLGVANGVTYRYRLRYRISGGSSPATEELATPSPVIPWVAEGGRRSLLRLSADARHTAIEEPRFSFPTQVAVDRARDNVWLLDGGSGSVVVYLPAIGARVDIPLVRSPACVAIDPADGSAWVSDTDNGIVHHLLASGGPGDPASLAPMHGPLGLAVDPVNRTLWVCDRRANQVRRFAPDGTLLGVTPVIQPSRVAIDSTTSEAWVTSFEGRRVHRLSPSGARLDSAGGFQGPVGIGVDTYRGRVWVADPLAGQVIALTTGALEEFRTGGLPGAVELDVETASGEAWVVATGRIARISPAGVVVVNTGLPGPTAIALDRFTR